MPFVAAVQTAASGQPVYPRLAHQPFAECSLAAPAILVADGLGCFRAVRGSGILHDPHVTGGSVKSARHPAFMAVNTALEVAE